jgi:hypothetical protein
MNEPTQGVRGDESERPQNDQDDSDGPQHFASPFCTDAKTPSTVVSVARRTRQATRKSRKAVSSIT